MFKGNSPDEKKKPALGGVREIPHIKMKPARDV